MKLFTRFLFCLIVCCSLGMLTWLLVQAYTPTAGGVPGSSMLDSLAHEGGRTGPADVPIGALVMVGDTILGRGHNTVVELGAAGGHAEINAISDALKKTGYKKFMQLDRARLTLISSFEPCPMCRGAIAEYRIRNVMFVKAKDAAYKLRKEIWPDLHYLFRKRRIESQLQDSLFHRRIIFN